MRGLRLTSDELRVDRRELFFSLHLDENHADCILRSCTVYLEEERPGGHKWDALGRHEFLAWRAYDSKKVYALGELPSRRLRDDYKLEARRTEKLKVGPAKKKARPASAPVDVDKSPVSFDELRCLWSRPRVTPPVTGGIGSFHVRRHHR